MTGLVNKNAEGGGTDGLAECFEKQERNPATLQLEEGLQ